MAKKDSGKDTNTSEEKPTETEDNSSMLDTLLGSQVSSMLGGLLDISGQAVKNGLWNRRGPGTQNAQL